MTNDDDPNTINYIKQNAKPYPLSREQEYDLSKPLKKEQQQNRNYTKLIIKAGRSDKLRPKDIIGALCTIIPFEDIGTLEIQDHYSTVIIKKPITLSVSTLSIKGKKRKIEPTNG